GGAHDRRGRPRTGRRSRGDSVGGARDAGARRQRGSSSRDPARPARAPRLDPAGRDRRRGSGGRDDERAWSRSAGPLRTALRPRQRRALSRAPSVSARGDPESLRRRRHAGRPGAARAAAGPEDARIAQAVGLALTLLPATDGRLRTRIRTPAGEFEFQEWFVARGHRDRADEVVYEGAAEARPAPGVLEALEAAELIAIAPSNPFVSIGPILAVGEIRAVVERRRDRVVAVSPLIGGRAVKGPADAMFTSLAGGTGAGQVTDCYEGLIGSLGL